MSGLLYQVANPPSTTLSDYRNVFELEDDFLTGTTGSGSVGQIGWNAAGTISGGTGSVANHPGTVIVDTGGGSGTIARLGCLGAGHFTNTYTSSVTWILKAAQIDANTTIRIGSANAFSSNPPNDGIYFERLDADTNWFVLCRAGSASSTRVDTGIPADTNYFRFRYEQTASQVQFFMNGTLVGTVNDHIPTIYISPGVFIINSTAASKKIEVDYFSLRAVGIGR